METLDIVIATNNPNKVREYKELFEGYDVNVTSLKEEGIVSSPEEGGTTFTDNALIKARDARKYTSKIVIADDSGICVDALNGAPGIYSSRYAGPDFMKGKPDGSKISQEEQNVFLINQLNNTLKNEKLPSASYLHGERSCHYTCAMVLYCGSDRLFVAQETFEGVLIKNIDEQAGNGGFGYDPIVFLPEYQKTVAQISADEKNAISHRGKAVKALKLIIDNLK